MYTHTRAYINVYAYIYTDIHIYMCIHIHMHLYTHTCTHIHIRMHMHTYAQIIFLETTPQRVKQYHRRTYASICICMHIHTYIHMHICAQPAASVFADVYVGIKTYLCNVHTCPCTSAQNTCQVHATLTAKKCTYIYTYTHMHTYTYAHEYTCACMTLSTR